MSQPRTVPGVRSDQAGPAAATGPRRRHDLRLFGFAAGAWAASLVALHASATAAVVAAIVSAGSAGLVVMWLRRTHAARHACPRVRPWRRLTRPGTGWLVAGVLLGVACGAVSTAARTSARDAQPLASLARAHASVRAELTVTDDPRRLHSAPAGMPTYLVPARLTRVDPQGGASVRLDVRVIVFASHDLWRDVLPSQRVATAARLEPARGGDLTAAVLSSHVAPELLHSPSWTQVVAGRLRAGLQAACRPLPAEPGGLLPGLVIGDTSRLLPELAEDFRDTGLTHLVAVSGANVAIVLAVVLFAARWCRLRPWAVAGACALALAGFVILARPSPSVVRAAAMGAVGLLALASGRSRAAAPALATAVVVGLLVDPALAGDPGFVLSALATGGLVLLAPRWRDGLRARGVPAGIAEALALPAAAQVVCAPVVAGLSGSVSLVAVVANMLAVPAVAPATLLGVGAAVMSAVWADGAAMLAWLACWPARWLVFLARTGATIPVGTLPWPVGVAGALALAAVTAAVLLAWRWPLLRRLTVAAALGVAIGAVPMRLAALGWPPGNAVVFACDVGQGEAIVLPVARDEAVVIDAGPDPVAVDGCLRRLGVRRIALLVVTHFHADHIGGVAGVLRARRLGGVALPTFDEPAVGERAVRAAAGAVEVTEAGPGWRYARGRLELRFLGPLRPLIGTRSDPNNNSLQLRAVNRGVSILLAADAEVEAQQDLLTLGPAALRSDVLKVAHHGSAYQDPDLLTAVDPLVALVSVGTGNRYGHPNPALLAQLSRDGARVVRTDRDGDLAVVLTGSGLGVVTAGHHVGRTRDSSAGPLPSNMGPESALRSMQQCTSTVEHARCGEVVPPCGRAGPWGTRAPGIVRRSGPGLRVEGLCPWEDGAWPPRPHWFSSLAMRSYWSREVSPMRSPRFGPASRRWRSRSSRRPR